MRSSVNIITLMRLITREWKQANGFTSRACWLMKIFFKDFNFVSLKEPIGPFFLDISPIQVRPFFLKFAVARIKPANVNSTISYIEERWNRIVPEYPFELTFLDENLNRMYKEQ